MLISFPDFLPLFHDDTITCLSAGLSSLKTLLEVLPIKLALFLYFLLVQLVQLGIECYKILSKK